MNHSRYLFIHILFFISASCCPIFLSASITPTDSLKALLKQTKNPQKRVEICNNLNDYCHYISKAEYPASTYLLLNEAIKAHYEYAITKALLELTMLVDRTRRTSTNDSIIRYLKIAEKNLTGEWKKSFLTEIRIREIRCITDWTDDEEKTVAHIMKQYTAPVKDEKDIYQRLEREYALGRVTGLTLSEWEDNIYESERYFDNLLALLEKLPVKFRANLFFCVSENLFTTYFNVEKKDKVVKMLRSMMNTLVQYNKLDFVQKEVYRNFDDTYALYYQGMSRCPEIIGKDKALFYLKEYEKISRQPSGSMLSMYYAYKEYHRSLSNYSQAILYADSVILALQDSAFSESPAVIASIYKEQSGYYIQLNDYKHAYERILKSNTLKDSISNNQSQKLRQEMSVRYDVNQLELETVHLESRNRIIGFIFMLVVLLLSVAWGITQRINLRKIQLTQKKLIASNQEVIRQSEKAQESEKMKTAFINSMCHEIRTPLNSISGFSSLLTDESIDMESKEEFTCLVQQNTHQLTQLINNLLEVSGLDSSNEELSVEPADVGQIAELEMDRLKSMETKPGINYHLNIKNDCIARTHAFYLARVISNLLNNANKFTENGSITLSCHKDEKKSKLVINVTDTGIGIPSDKSEWVFERFTKINDFKPGTGMGLYVCRLITNRLNGSIMIDKKYTEGTKFVITLPL